MNSICNDADVIGRLSRPLNKFMTTCTPKARNRIPGPYTKPFQPRAAVANEIPDRVAFAMTVGFTDHISLIPASKYKGFLLGLSNSLSEPRPSIALTQK